MSKRFRDWRRKIKFALSSDGAFHAVTGAQSLEEIKWAYEACDEKEKEYANWLSGKMRLDKYKGKYLVAFFYMQGKTQKELGKKMSKDVDKATKMMVKKFKLDKEGE